MMKWLYKRGETYIDGFDFKKLKRIDRGLDENRRASFDDDEVIRINSALKDYIREAEADLQENGNLIKAITGYYLGFSLITGLRRGEQLQLAWNNVDELDRDQSRKKPFELIQITVRGTTSKVGKTRKFVVKDSKGYFNGILRLKRKLKKSTLGEQQFKASLANELIFSSNGTSPITPRAIGYHFEKLMEIAKIENLETRDLVPYSFRHYFITQRVNSHSS